MARPRTLTPIEEVAVCEMHKENKPIAEIAYKFGISASTVQRIVRKYKITEENENNGK